MPINNHTENTLTNNSDIVLSWTVHLASTHPSKLLFSAAFIMLCSAAGYYTLGVLGAIAAAIVMVASLADFIFPVKYVITRDSAKCMMLLKAAEIKWGDVKHCYVDNLGVKLSPLPRLSRLEAFRGVYLRFGDNKEQVIDTVKTLKDARCTE